MAALDERTVRDRIERLRRRLAKVEDQDDPLVPILKAVLDLLADTL